MAAVLVGLGLGSWQEFGRDAGSALEGSEDAAQCPSLLHGFEVYSMHRRLRLVRHSLV